MRAELQVRRLSRLFCWLLLAMVGMLTRPCAALNPQDQISQYGHTAWRMADGVFASKPTSIAQTPDGYIWLGTANGLLRFDGVRFLPWTPPGGQFKDPSVWSLLAGKDGSLWIGTRSQLFRLLRGKLAEVPNIDAWVESLFEDEHGVIWLARGHVGPTDKRGGLCSVTGLDLRCYGAKDGMPALYGGQAIGDKNGNLWFAGEGFTKWRAGVGVDYALHNEAMPKGLEAGGPQALAVASDGSLWAGMLEAVPGRGLQHLVNEQFSPVILPGFDSSKLRVAALFNDPDDSLWVGTMDQGIYRIHGNSVSHYGATDGLTSDAAYNFLEDAEGSLWVITSDGLDYFHNLPVATYSMREGLSGAKASTVVAARDGAIWVGNYFAVDVLRGATVTSIKIPGTMVTSLLEGRDGRMWVGVDGKLCFVEPGTTRLQEVLGAVPVGGLASIAEDEHGDIWINTDHSLTGKLYRIHGSVRTEQVLPPEAKGVYTLASDPAGGLWLGLRSGDLGHLKNGEFHLISEPHGKGFTPLRGIGTNSSGFVLAGQLTALLLFRDGRSAVMGAKNGLPFSKLNSWVTDQHGNMFLNTDVGILDIAQDELERWWKEPESKLAYRQIGPLDGARIEASGLTPAAARSPDGRLWFVNERVLQVFDPDHRGFNPLPPPVVIGNLVENGKKYDGAGPVTFPSQLRTLSISYAGLSFMSPQRVLFRYRLEGHDSEWQEAGTRREALYNDLGPGKYTFHVIACNNNGVWNQIGASVQFTVKPAFYQTLWFRALEVLGFAGVLWALYMLRLRAATARLETRLLERFSERERIARELHDTLLQGFQAVIWSFQGGVNGIAPDTPIRSSLDKAIDKAQALLVDGRDRVRALRSKTAPRLGLAEEANLLAEEIRHEGQVAIEVLVSGTPMLLNELVQDETLAILKEAMTNSIRHGHAQHILCEIVFEKARLVVTCRDDGSGIPPDVLKAGSREGHFGLVGMKERASQIAAVLELKENEPEGTLVRLTVKSRMAYRYKRAQD